eukprot:GHVT01025046.1.p1 GENE.GHVT01025046.1~~GHVT01025046.1.p1  ORF type:complete len:112 (+),score=20.54 GHVT01025046.1:291-626(+)
MAHLTMSKGQTRAQAGETSQQVARRKFRVHWLKTQKEAPEVKAKKEKEDTASKAETIKAKKEEEETNRSRCSQRSPSSFKKGDQEEARIGYLSEKNGRAKKGEVQRKAQAN